MRRRRAINVQKGIDVRRGKAGNEGSRDVNFCSIENGEGCKKVPDWSWPGPQERSRTDMPAVVARAIHSETRMNQGRSGPEQRKLKILGQEMKHLICTSEELTIEKVANGRRIPP